MLALSVTVQTAALPSGREGALSPQAPALWRGETPYAALLAGSVEICWWLHMHDCQIVYVLKHAFPLSPVMSAMWLLGRCPSQLCHDVEINDKISQRQQHPDERAATVEGHKHRGLSSAVQL